MQVVNEAVTHLVIGNVLGWFGHPVQHLHAIAACTGVDHMKDFPSAAVVADLHAGQVPHFADQGTGVGLV
ncbi:hypothetical protein D3C84_1197810 [compost metagenome]